MTFTLTAYVDHRQAEVTWSYDDRKVAMRAFNTCSKTERTHDDGSSIAWVRLDHDSSNRRIAYAEF